MLLIATAAFRCPGPDPEAEPGSGGGATTATTTTGEGAAGGGTVTTGAGGEGGCGPTDSNPMNCGACGRQCLVGGPTVMPRCTMGVCNSVCASGSVNISRPTAPAPDDGCEAPGRRVFVSKATRQGNFGLGVGGPPAADMICGSTATMAGLGGNWRAWVSDMVSSPSTWYPVLPPPAPYVLLDGTVVANDFAELTNPSLELAHAIDQFEDGTPAITVEVWTGTDAAGNWSIDNCLDWTFNQNVSDPVGWVGLSNATLPAWTTAYTQTCDRNQHFYCFEQ